MFACGMTVLQFTSVPLHQSLKTGMLHSILSEVAEKRAVDIESIL
jgi:hypothetical protein